MSTLSVPPVFPEPATVAGNVADASRAVQVQFLRTTWLMILLCLAYVFSWAVFYNPPMIQGTLTYFLAVAASVVLSVLRLTPGKPVVKLVISGLIFIVAGPLYGSLLVQLEIDGMPLGLMLLFATLVAYLYAQLTGRDYSFLGQFLVSLSAGLACFLFMERTTGDLGWHLWGPVAIWLVICFYLSYNLACVMRRRRPEEWIESALDMFRDPLNLLTYPVRVIQHWHRYPVWDPHRKG
ncbi:MAG: hypothetical protein ACK4P3_00670 [Fimbriimonadaceae bacterium]